MNLFSMQFPFSFPALTVQYYYKKIFIHPIIRNHEIRPSRVKPNQPHWLMQPARGIQLSKIDVNGSHKDNTPNLFCKAEWNDGSFNFES